MSPALHCLEANEVDETQRQYHDVANIFPLMTGADFEALKADIAEHGLREPIWLHPDGRIIDGRNRHRACIEAGIAPEFRTWDGNGLIVPFVVSLNLHRRHLTESQRAMIAARLANMAEGRPTENRSIDLVSQSEAADMLNVSVPSTKRARAVQANGAPELVEAVERGDVAVSAAAQVATLPQEWQRVIVEHNEVPEVATELRQGRADAVEKRVQPHVTHNSGNNEWYTPAEDDQRRGIDRWLVNSAGKRISLEYKTDVTAGRTGNAFVETISVSTADKPGWAVSSQATWLIYYIPDPEAVYIIKFARIRQHLARWREQYPSRDIPNVGYVTTGLLVPLREFEQIAARVL